MTIQGTWRLQFIVQDGQRETNFVPHVTIQFKSDGRFTFKIESDRLFHLPPTREGAIGSKREKVIHFLDGWYEMEGQSIEIKFGKTRTEEGLRGFKYFLNSMPEDTNVKLGVRIENSVLVLIKPEAKRSLHFDRMREEDMP